MTALAVTVLAAAAAVVGAVMERAHRRDVQAPPRRMPGDRYVAAPGFPRRDNES